MIEAPLEPAGPTHEDEGPQFDRCEDRSLLGAVSAVPGALLVLGLGAVLTGAAETVALALLSGHFITQFIVLLVYGALLTNDESLERLGRAMWAAAFLVAAPVALPMYFWFCVRDPMPREPHADVYDVPLAHAT